MAKITRQTAKIFGSTATSGEIAQFGSLAASAPVTYSGSTATPALVQALGNWLTGWFAGVEGANSPAIEDLNAYCYVMAYQMAYQMQAGIAEWDAGTTYYIGSLAQDSTGNIYVSITDTNLNNALSVTADWQPMLKLINSGFSCNLLAPTLAANQSITMPLVPTHPSTLAISTTGVLSTVSRQGATTAGIGGVAISTSINFSTTSVTPVDVTNSVITLQTSGRPVQILLQPDGSVSAAILGLQNATPGTSTFALVTILRATHSGSYTVISFTEISNYYKTYYPPSSISFVDFVNAGNYDYKLQIYTADGTSTISIADCNLLAYEIS